MRTWTRPSHALGLALALWLAPAVAGWSAGTPAEPVGEYEVKAALLVNFARFVTWPGDAQPAEGSPFVIGVLGDNVFGTSLARATEDQLAQGRHLVARHVRGLNHVEGVHVLYVAPGAPPLSAADHGRLSRLRVLTVGEGRDFLRRGGVIGLQIEQRRLRMHVSPAAADRAGLRVSSQLLRLAVLHDVPSTEKEP